VAVKVGELIADRYELEQLVGEGGMSSVYRAHDTVLERRVAIKVLHEHYSSDPEYVERFRREARAIARLAHPNVVTVIDRGEWDGRQFIVFEHVAGENLKTAIERVGAMPVRRALALGIQIARALAYAHELEIVHRDVKPHNVLLDPAGTAKVTDFGIARTLDVDEALTQTGTVLGTGQYLSPEQANGGRGDERSDQYSLGVVMFELLAGEVPYSGGSLMAVAMRHVNDPVPSVRERRPEVPARLDSVVACAMAKSPEDRFPSMRAMVAALEACLADLPDDDRLLDRQEDTGVMAPPPAPPPPALPPTVPTRTVASRPPPTRPERPRPRRRAGGPRLLVLLLGIAGVIAAGLIALEATRDDGVTGLLDGPGGGGGSETRVPLQAVADFDPFGDNREEHPEAVPAASDGNRETFWTTETYNSFEKDGVGIVLDARSPVELTRLTVVTDTPGFTAMILAGSEEAGPFEDVSESQQVEGRTTFEVDTRGEAFRYYLVWITALESTAHVNEVRGFRET
jgi:eukaryotic-like serine/threonine-protein kinase